MWIFLPSSREKNQPKSAIILSTIAIVLELPFNCEIVLVERIEKL